MKQIKLGVIGGGVNSAVGYAHFCASRLDNFFIYHKGCFSRDIEINKESAIKYGITENNVYESISDLINDSDDIDSWLILTPTPTHFSIINKLKLTNKKIICEKALCSSITEAKDISLKFTDNELYVIFNYTGYPMIREIKNIIKDQGIGNLININIEMPQSGFIKQNDLGEIPKPQDWRLFDDSIATLSLDLGVHVHSLINFLCNIKPIELFAISNSKGGNDNLIDNLHCLIKFESNVTANIWYSKTSLGHSNGLKVRIFGSEGAIEWVQIKPDEFKLTDQLGFTRVIDMGSILLKEASKSKYNRFKAGHPTGFIEALSNYYRSIYDSINGEKDENLFTLTEAIDGIELMEIIHTSIRQNELIKI